MTEVTTIQERLNKQAEATAKKELAEQFAILTTWLKQHNHDWLGDVMVYDKGAGTVLAALEQAIRPFVIIYYQERATAEFIEKVESLDAQLAELRDSIPEQ